jgi:O-antigen biosynthesis protein
MQQKISRALSSLRKKGVRKTFERLLNGPTRSVEDRYKFLKNPKSAAVGAEVKVAENTINWFFSGFGGNSGGHINIVRFLRGLETLGYECRIVFPDGRWLGSPERMREHLQATMGTFKANVYLHSDDAPAAFASIATGYETAYEVRNFNKSSKKFYFVQDYEPWFNSEGTNRQIAEDSYKLGLIGITAGSWLAEKLNNEFSMQTFAFGFAFDKTLYTNLPRKFGKMKRVFFYARPETERRGYELGILALAELCSRRSDIEVVLAGSALKQERYSFPAVKLGALNIKDLGQVYASCDISLVLSFTNASLLPLELMACGTPVVSNNGPFVEWLLKPEFSKLTAPNYNALATGMAEVLDDANEWERLHKAGLGITDTASWDAEIAKVASTLAMYECKAISNC